MHRPGRRRCLAWAAAGLTLAAAAPARASTHTVLPGQSLQRALMRAFDGDVIEIHGEHRGQVAVIGQRQLTLRGVGTGVVLHADGQHAEGKGTLVVRHGDIRIENLEFRGARVPDRNGAGIRFERGRLLVQGCRFVDNENGILTGNVGDAELVVRDSRFADAPADTPLPHLLYVGRIARVAISGCHFSGGRQGHLVKSRARDNRVFHNRLDDRPAGQAAYELEFPLGGLAWVVGNVIAQSAGTSNPVLLSFGAEGLDDRPQGLFVAHNTFVNEALKPAMFIRAAERPGGQAVEQRIVNNVFVGLGLSDIDWGDAARGNLLLPPALLKDARAADPRLPAGSLLRGRAVAAGSAQGVSLQPQEQIALPLGTRPLAAPRAWSAGAFQD